MIVLPDDEIFKKPTLEYIEISTFSLTHKSFVKIK